MLAAIAQAAAGPAPEYRAVIFRQVDEARAVFCGLVLVGHRVSVELGEMFWALPGRQLADSVSLLGRDPAFRVITSPTVVDLVKAKAKLLEIEE